MGIGKDQSKSILLEYDKKIEHRFSRIIYISNNLLFTVIKDAFTFNDT